MSSHQKFNENDTNRLIGPVYEPDELVPSGGIGPVLPPYLMKKFDSNEELDCIESADVIGPLAPGLELKDEWRHLKSTVCFVTMHVLFFKIIFYNIYLP